MIAYVQSTHLEYRVSTTSASMLIPLFKPLCLGHISRLSKLGKRATIYPSLDRETVDRVVETSSPQKRWAERAQRSRRGSWKRVEMLSCPPSFNLLDQAKKDSPLSVSLSRHISIKAERTARTSRVYPPIHPWNTNAQRRRKEISTVSNK